MHDDVVIREVRVEVTTAAGWPTPLSTSALVVVPSTLELRTPPCVLFAYPGGTHAKEYYDMHIPGFRDYSMAAHFARLGYVFVACDPLGVGGSSTPLPDDQATRRTFVDGNQGTVEGVLALLASGQLVDGLGPVEDATTIGMGTSMGAMLLIEQQATHRAFDGIVVMGYSGIQTRLATPPEGWAPPPGYVVDNRDLFYTLYWDDVPDEIIAADQAHKVVPPAAAVRAGGGYKMAMDAGNVADAVAAIESPVLIAVGERDTCPDPHAEPAAYRSSLDVSVYVVPRAGHAPSVANTRHLLWDRIEAFAAWVTGSGAARDEQLLAVARGR